jgi:hypothetical protein
MSAPNPFIDPGDGHVLADDGEKHRTSLFTAAKNFPNPWLMGIHPVTGLPGYGMPLPAIGLSGGNDQHSL